MRNFFGSWIITILVLSTLAGCKTKSELRREQDLDRMKAELKEVRGERADVDNLGEEFKVEISRMNNLLEERAAQSRSQMDELRKEIAGLNTKISKLESHIEAQENADREARNRANVAQAQAVAAAPKPTYELGKKYYDDGKYEDAIDVLKTVSKGKKGEEAKKAQFLLGEALYANKEFASAALEYSDYKRLYPKDSLVPQAIYRQANAFKSMGKSKEAKLFYQELIERYPKANMIAKAKQEMKKLR